MYRFLPQMCSQYLQYTRQIPLLSNGHVASLSQDKSVGLQRKMPRVCSFATFSKANIQRLVTIHGKLYSNHVSVQVRSHLLEIPFSFCRSHLACALQVDAHPFKHWYENHYGLPIGLKKGKKAPPAEEEVGISTSVARTPF